MEYYIGFISLLPYNFIPYGWMLCDGSVLQVSQYQALYALIGNTYGGNGSTTFALPNMQGLEPVPNMKYCIVPEGLFPVRP